MTPLGTTLRQPEMGSGSSSPAHPGPDPAPKDHIVTPCTAQCQYKRCMHDHDGAGQVWDVMSQCCRLSSVQNHTVHSEAKYFKFSFKTTQRIFNSTILPVLFHKGHGSHQIL